MVTFEPVKPQPPKWDQSLDFIKLYGSEIEKLILFSDINSLWLRPQTVNDCSRLEIGPTHMYNAEWECKLCPATMWYTWEKMTSSLYTVLLEPGNSWGRSPDS